MQQDAPTGSDTQDLEVWIDQDLCTGDGICVQYAPEVFELDIDGLAYVKSSEDELLQDKGRRRPFRCRCFRTWSTRPRSAPATAFMYGAFRTGSRSTAPRLPDPAGPAGSATYSNRSGAACLVLGSTDEGAVPPLPGHLFLLVGAATRDGGRGVAEERGGDDPVTHGEVADAHLLRGVHQGRNDPGCGPASL